MSKLKNIITGIALTGLTAFGAADANAQNNVEYIQTDKIETSRIRPNLFYNLPGGVKAYTFIEFYAEGDSYYAKTTLNKEIAKNLSVRSEIKNGTGFKDLAMIGLTYKLPVKNMSASLKFLPATVNTQGDVKTPLMVGYFISKDFGPVNFTSFADYNLKTNTMGYGEAHLSVGIGDKIDLGVGVDARSDDKNIVEFNPSLKLKYNL